MHKKLKMPGVGTVSVFFCALFLFPATQGAAQFSNPFTAEASLETADDGRTLLKVALTVPFDHYLYNDMLEVKAVEPGVALEPKDIPKPKAKKDPITGESREIYEHDFALVYYVSGFVETFSIQVSYQGCDATTCYLPQTQTFNLKAEGKTSVAPIETEKEQAPATEDRRAAMDTFKVVGMAAGFIETKEFLEFLDRVESGEAAAGLGGGAERLANMNIWLAILLILVGGLALNLTPCVLPMIPINLAIIGAGVRASSRRRGFLLGGAYGAGVAGCYGALGLAVVLAGAKFGALNSAPWFNFVIALLFVVLALAMFGVFQIDLTRFKKTTGGASPGGKRSFIAVFFMGVVSALLAGACVAPVVISVLLWSSSLYAKGNSAALILPFLLGLGMALPWPFAGMGLSLLPRPGKWMLVVKNGFAVLILLFGVYYGWMGVSLLESRSSSAEATEIAARQKEIAKEGEWTNDLEAALALARKENKPVFIDFWATWCKSCLAMEKSTFRDPEVRERLRSFVAVKYQAENPNDPEVKEILDRFGIIGLPAYVALRP